MSRIEEIIFLTPEHISGDLCQETAILARNLGITLIDLGHHESEVPGLYALADLLSSLNITIKAIDKKPIQYMEL